MDYISDILDEIALEGLDGITIDGLWLRLSERPNFMFGVQTVNDSDTQVFLWNVVRRLRQVEFFQLEEPRKPLNIYPCYTVDFELGIITETNSTPEDLYPHKLINNAEDGTIGSCSTYDTRVNVTSAVRKLDLDSVLTSYSANLVIVANQNVRKRTLINLHTNPSLEVSAIQFCILERVGRSRFHGEPTRNKFGLAALGEDPKTIFYLRKYLLKHNLITKQVYQQKTAINKSGLLLHLPRFFSLVKPRYILMIEDILKILADQPNNLIEYNTLRERLPGVLKRLTKVAEFQKYLRTDVRVPYRTLYPDADVRQWKQKSSDKEKKIRVVELRDPGADIRVLQKRLVSHFDEEDEDDDKIGGILNEENRYIDVAVMTQCSMLLKGHGVDGLSQSQIARGLGFPKVQARTITKNLVKTGAANMYMIDVGRQRITKYYLRHCNAINENHKFILNNSSISENHLPIDENLESTSSCKDTDKTISLENQNISLDSNRDSESLDVTTNGIDDDDKNDVDESEHVIKRKSKKRRSSFTNLSSSVKEKKTKLQSDDEKENESTEICSSNSRKNVEQFRKETIADESDKGELGAKESVANTDERMDVDDKEFDTRISVNNVDVANENQNDKDTCQIADNPCEPVILSTPKNDSNKLQIDVTISEDYSWLLPKTCKREVEKIQNKSLKTFRLLKRSNLIMEAVHKSNIITDLKKLVILINESEFKDGLKGRMDKKSMLRILFKLASDKHIKVFRVALKHSGRVIFMNFICNMNVKPDDPVILSAIEFNKLKFHTMNITKDSIPIHERPKRVKVSVDRRNSFNHYPKFNRMKIMHRFLFSLVYDYTGNDALDQTVAKSKITKDRQMSEDELDMLPKLYSSRIDEYMFVPPLPKHNEQGSRVGWCLMSDVLVRLPLTVFLHLVQIPYFIPELDEYLNHPIKKYYLVSDLPTKIHNCITATRKYIFTIYEVMMKLAYIGLLQFGAHHNKEKDQIFTFINRNATLLDTTLSKPGYNRVSTDVEYSVQKYHFESIQNVDQYWHNCWKICMNTQLGGRSHALGTDVVVENIQDKQEMINAVRPREFAEAPDHDTGYVPGDKLGAAGFDSALFAHLKRNWVFKSKSAVQYDNAKSLQVRKVQHLVASVNNNAAARSSKRKTSDSTTHSTVTKQNGAKNTSTKDKNLSINPVNRVSKGRKPNIKIRRINPVKKSLHRKPFYDQIDKEALKHMSKLRVDWTLEEDRILLICKVASSFICADTRKQVNANIFLAYREVLHKTLQSSKNKTSRACQRRVAYMLRSASMRHNINLCIEELKQDEYITEKYGNTLELIKQEAKIKGKRVLEVGNIWRDRFRGLVSDLMDRYDNKNFNHLSFTHVIDNKFNNGFVMPDDLEQFHDTYNLQHIEKKQHKPKDMFTPVTNISEIYSAVINSTIHSTLSCNSDKTSWSYHLFSIYQQYPERILRHTLNRLRENHMVSYKKSYQVRNKSGNSYYLPLSASPYQLSISYVNLIQTRYQSSMYLDCCEMFLELLANCSVDQTKSMGDLNNGKGYELFSPTGGSTAAIAELYSSGVVEFNIEIPNQVIILDPNVKDKDETYSRLVQRYKDVLTNYKKDLTSSVLFQKHNYLASCNSNDLNLEEYETYSFVRSDEKNQDEEKNDNVRAMQNVAKAASRIALYMMNDDKANTAGLVPKEMDHVYDFFVVNSCKLFVKIVRHLDSLKDNTSPAIECDPSCNVIDKAVIKSTLQSIRDSALFYNIDPSDQDGVTGCELTNSAIKDDDEDDGYKVKDYDDVVLDKIVDCNFKADDVHNVKSILAAIKLKNEFGLTNKELVEEFGNSFKIVELINKLIDLSFVLKTGVVHSRYIYFKHVRPWVLHSYRNLRYDRDNRVPMQNIRHFTVRQRSDSFEEVCSDDEHFDPKQENNDVNLSVSSKNGQISETNTNAGKIVEKNQITKIDLNSTIDDTRWCLSKEELNTLTNSKISEPVRVVMRPWIRVDSSLNRRVLDMMLCSVLSHIMLYPGVSLSSIQYRFSPAYQPYHTYELCAILMKLNCIIRYCVVTKSKPSLFSKPCEIVIEQSTGLESENDIRYEADKFAIVNLGKFLDTRPYTKDFIKCLIGK